MDFINLFINNPIACIAVVSLSLNWFIFRRSHVNSEKIGTLQSTITNKDNEIQRLISERGDIERDNKKTFINTENKYKRELDALIQENANLIKELNHLKSPKKFTEPVIAKTDFDVFK